MFKIGFYVPKQCHGLDSGDQATEWFDFGPGPVWSEAHQSAHQQTQCAARDPFFSHPPLAHPITRSVQFTIHLSFA